MKLPRRETLLALAVFVLIAAISTWPMVVNPRSTIFGAPGDSTGSIADLWYQNVTGLKVFGHRSVTIQGAPLGFVEDVWPLITSSLLIVPAWVVMHVFSDVFTYNTLVFSGLVLTALATFALLRYLSVRSWLAIVGGGVFTILPYHMLTATSWYSQTHLEALPLSVLFGLKFFEKPGRQSASRFIGVAIVGFLTNAYVGLMCAVVVVTVFTLVLFRTWLRQNWKRRNLSILFAVLGLGSVLIVVRLARSFIGLDLKRGSGELDVYGLRLSEWLRPNRYSSFWGTRPFASQFVDLHGSNPVEVSHYVGIVLFALATLFVAFVAVTRGNSPVARGKTVSLISVAAAAIWLSMSQGIHLGRFEFLNGARWIFNQAPYWRVFSRLSLIASLVVVVLAMLAMETISRWFERDKSELKRRLGSIAIASICLLAVIDVRIKVPVHSTDVRPTAIAEAIRTYVPSTFVAYPIKPWYDPWTYDLRFWQRTHARPMLNGGNGDPKVVEIQAALLNPLRPESLDLLDALGIHWVVVDQQQFAAAFGAPIRPNPRLILRRKVGRYHILNVKPDPEASGIWIESSNYGPELNQDGRTWRWLVEKSAVFRIITRSEGCFKIVVDRQAPDGSIPEIQTQIGRDSQSFNSLETPRYLPQGHTDLKLLIETRPETLVDGRRATVYLANPRIEPLPFSHCIK